MGPEQHAPEMEVNAARLLSVRSADRRQARRILATGYLNASWPCRERRQTRLAVKTGRLALWQARRKGVPARNLIAALLGLRPGRQGTE